MARFAPYANYLAYSSDVGESFRLIASASMVRASYGLAVAYCVGDIAFNGYLEYGKSKGDMGSICIIWLIGHENMYSLIDSSMYHISSLMQLLIHLFIKSFI